MMANVWWSLPLTLIILFAVHRLTARYKFPPPNLLLIAMVVIIPFLMLTNISCSSCFKGNEVLNDLPQLAVVALAYPLYEQLHQIRARWKSIATVCFIGNVVTMVTGAFVALLIGASSEITVSILSKSVTTPIVMAVGDNIGGIPAISAVYAIFVDILGAMLGRTLLDATRIHIKAVHSLTMGTAPYTLGTACYVELDYQKGAFGSLALVLYGITTSLIALFLFPIILAVMGQNLRCVMHFRCKLHTLRSQ